MTETTVAPRTFGAAPRAPPVEGWFAPIGEGLAASLTGRPEFSAIVLLALATWFRNGALAIGLAHVAGAVLRRVPPPRRIAIVAGWILLAVVNELAASDGSGGTRQLYGFIAISFSFGLFALAWGAGTKALWSIAFAGAVASAIALGFVGGSGSGSVATWLSVYGLLHGLGLLLGRQGRFRLAIGLAVLAVVSLTAFVAISAPASLTGRFLPAWLAGLAGTGVSFLAVVVCGDAARAVEHEDAGDGGASLLVALGRTPWRSALFVAILASAPGRTWSPNAPDFASSLASLGGVVAVSALVAGLAMPAGGVLALLAPLLAVSIVMSTSGVVAVLSPRAGLPKEWSLVVAAAQLLPLLLLRPAFRIGRWEGGTVTAFAALALFFPAVALACGVGDDPAVLTAWIVLVVLSIGAAAECDRPAAHIVANAVMLGFVSRALVEVMVAARFAAPVNSSLLNLPWTWFLAAVTAVVVRRARTISVVPADHPIYTEVVQRA